MARRRLSAFGRRLSPSCNLSPDPWLLSPDQIPHLGLLIRPPRALRLCVSPSGLSPLGATLPNVTRRYVFESNSRTDGFSYLLAYSPTRQSMERHNTMQRFRSSRRDHGPMQHNLTNCSIQRLNSTANRRAIPQNPTECNVPHLKSTASPPHAIGSARPPPSGFWEPGRT